VKSRWKENLQLGAEQADNIIGGDDTGQLVVIVDHRQREQIVLIK